MMLARRAIKSCIIRSVHNAFVTLICTQTIKSHSHQEARQTNKLVIFLQFGMCALVMVVGNKLRGRLKDAANEALKTNRVGHCWQIKWNSWPNEDLNLGQADPKCNLFALDSFRYFWPCAPQASQP